MSQAGLNNTNNSPPPPGTVVTLTGNTGGAVGPNGAGNINFPGATLYTVTGNPGTNTLTINPLPNAYPITPYVVGPVGAAGYQTIQSAINAANTAGGGVVYIQPGAYTENLTLFSGVDLYGTPAVSQNQGASTSITGTHTPPASGHVGFNSICFISTTNVFLSAVAGSTHIVFLNCESAVQNGYFLNLPNWTGILEIFDNNPSTAGAPFAVNDGGINNTGGATLFMFGAALGSGTNIMNLSGTVVVGQSSINCPVTFGTGSNISIQDMQFFGTVTLSGNATGAFDTCNFYGGTSAAITMSSSAAIRVASSTVSSTNNPAISGAGAGTFTYTDITFISNAALAGTLTTATTSWQPYSRAIAATDGTKVGTCAFKNTQFAVDANGFVTLSGSGTGQTITGDSGGALSPSAGNWNILGRSGSKTSGSGSTLTINSPPFSQVGGSGTSVLNSGEFVTAAVTRTLPATAGLLDGDLVIYSCTTAGALVVTANTAQTIRVGSLVSSAAGTATSTAIGDSLTLRFDATAVVWRAVSVIGTWLIA